MADLDKTTALDVGIDPQVLAEAERLYQFKVQNVVTNAKLIKPTPQRPPPK